MFFLFMSQVIFNVSATFIFPKICKSCKRVSVFVKKQTKVCMKSLMIAKIKKFVYFYASKN